MSASLISTLLCTQKVFWMIKFISLCICLRDKTTFFLPFNPFQLSESRCQCEHSRTELRRREWPASFSLSSLTQFSQWKTQRYTFLLLTKWQQNKALDQCIKEKQRSDTNKKQASLSPGRDVNTRIFGSSQLGCRLNVCSLTPGCQNSQSRCARFKHVNRSGVQGREKHFKKRLVFQICWRLESPECERYCVLLAPRTLVDLHSGKWSNVIPGARKPQSSRWAKWYSWKAVKNRVALDQSNDDPAGRAEQLKESPRERWELLTATEGLHSIFFFSPSLSQDSLGLALMKTLLEILKKKNKKGEEALITEGGNGGEERRGSPALQRHFLSNLICCISYFWSAVSCIMTYKFISRFQRVDWLNLVQAE